MSLLVEHLLNRPDPGHPLLVEEGAQWSLSGLRENVFCLASALHARGIQPGDRVALMFMNQKEYLLGLFAILHAGAIAVPINITLPPEDILYVIVNSGARLVLTTASFAPHFEGKPLPILVANQIEITWPSFEDAIAGGDPGFPGVTFGTPDDARILMYTSGSTGKPKGVMLSENNLLANLDGIAPLLQLHPTDRVLLALPIFHAYGQMIALYAPRAQAMLCFVPNFSPKKIIQALLDERITLLPLVPTLFSVLLGGIQKANIQLPALRACVSGGAALPEALLREIETTPNIAVLEGYGLTEASPVVAINAPERDAVPGSIRPGSVGRPLSNVDVQLADDQGKRTAWTPGLPSIEGEILVKGPSVMQGYYHLPEDTALAFDPEGYLRAGDLGRFDAEGNLYISGGRKKDLIIKAGEYIAPVRIEEVLHRHPAVLTASVIGILDDKLGEDILACVECKPEQHVTETELKKFCREHLPPFMIPAAIRPYDALPKNPVGKVLKPVLREQNATCFRKHPVS